MVKRIKKNKSLSFKKLISPLLFNENSSFYFIIKNVELFRSFTENLNLFKSNEKEIDFLKNIIDEYDKKEELSKKSEYLISPIPFYKNLIDNLKEVQKIYDNIDINIKNIFNNINKQNNISLNKIRNIYLKRYGNSISKSALHRKFRNKYKYSSKKVSIKPKALDEISYTSMSFLFIKIIIRSLLLKFDLIFIDESNFQIKKENYKTWVNKDDQCHWGYKKR